MQNQCDGCARGLTLRKGIHYVQDGHGKRPDMACSKSLYEKRIKGTVFYDVDRHYPDPRVGFSATYYLPDRVGLPRQNWASITAPVIRVGSNGSFETEDAVYYPNRILSE